MEDLEVNCFLGSNSINHTKLGIKENVFVDYVLPQKRNHKIEDLEENHSLQRIPLNHAKLGVKENGNGSNIKVNSIENPSRPGRRNKKNIKNKRRLNQVTPFINSKLTPIEEVSDDFL